MNLIIKKTLGALLALQATHALAESGKLFDVTTSGSALGQTVSYTLCLTINGKNPLSCQNYSTSTATLSIKTTVPHHTYHYAGIKINTPDFRYTGQGFRAMTRKNIVRETAPEGYTFIGTVSDTQTATGTVSPVGNANTALSVSITDLALSISGLTLNGQQSGQARTITISNTGGATATGVNIDYPTWPAGTTATSDCGATLAAHATCTITVTPSTTPTSNCSNNGIAPTPGVITISAANATAVISNVVILNYGCIYQGGYIFAMTETADTAESIGGTVVTQTDEAERYPNGVFWSSDAQGTDADFNIIYGISEISTTGVPNPNTNQVTGQVACNGAIDGACNSDNIIAYYSPPTTAPAITPSYYAAGLCTTTISGYSDWYLPAICEMGPASNGSGCVTGTQNIVDQLSALLGDPYNNPGTSCTYGANCLAGYYWSSTELSNAPQRNAWAQFFASGGGSHQVTGIKANLAGVRCVRVLSP